MANWIITDSINLRHPTNYVQGASEEVLMLPIDNKAHTWQVVVRDGDTDADLTGKSCYAYFARNDNAKVLVNGTITDNVCSVTLDSTCYAIPGFLRAVMIMSDTEQTVAICEKTFRVNPALPGQTVDPGEILPSIDDLLAEIGAMRLATADANAAASAAQTATTAANTAAQTANTNANAAQTAANNANQATTAANQATTAANTAAQNANTKADAAQAAANNAYQAATSATEATSAAQTATNDANTAAQNANTAASTITTQIDRLDRMDRNQNGRLTNIESVTEGFLYDDVKDSVTAYSKTVPDNTLPFANLDMIGGKTLVWNQHTDFENRVDTNYAAYNFKFNVPFVKGHKYYCTVEIGGRGTDWNDIFQYCSFGFWTTDLTKFLRNLVSNVPSGRFVNVISYNDLPSGVENETDLSTFVFQVAGFSGSGSDIKIWAEKGMVIDLTQMFGAGNEPTVEQFEAMFPADYYPYSEPTLLNFSADKVVSKGKNLFTSFDDWGDVVTNDSGAVRFGKYYTFDKETDVRISFKFDTFPGTGVILAKTRTGDTFSANSYPDSNGVISIRVPYGASLIVLIGTTNRESAMEYIRQYNIHDIQIEVGTVVTTYIPYFESTNDLSPLVSKYFPDGMKSVGDVYDSFEKDDAGKWWAVQRVGSVDLGTLTWDYFEEHNRFRNNNEISDMVKKNVTETNKVMSCAKYMPTDDVWITNDTDGCAGNMALIYIRDNNAQGDVTTFVQRLQGVTLYYELANYIRTEVTDSFPYSINVETGGTITFVNDQGVDYHMPLPNAETWKFNLGSDVVRYDTEQSLTDAQKTTARNNIGAADKDEVDVLKKDDKSLTRRVENLEAASIGQLYRSETDNDEAYSKAIPGDVLPWATLDNVGGKTLVWNQLLHDYNNKIKPYAGPGGGWDITNGNIYDPELHEYTLTVTKTVEAWNIDIRINNSPGQFDSTHVYAISTWAKIVDHGDSYPQNFRWVGETIQATTPLTSTYTRLVYVGVWGNPSFPRIDFESRYEPYDSFTVKAKDLLVFDLTQMFGAGNEPTAEEFEAMFPADYYPYSEPTLMNFSADKVVSKGKNLLDVMDYTNLVSANPPVYKGNGVYHFSSTGANAFIEYLIDVTPGKKYRVCAKLLESSGAGASQAFETVTVYDGDTVEAPTLLRAAGLKVGNGAKFFTPTGTKVIAHFSLSGGNGGAEVDVYLPMIWEETDYTSTDEWYYSIAKSYFESTNDISPLVQKYFPDGMKSAGDVYDEIDLKRGVAIQRVGSVDMGTLNWSMTATDTVDVGYYFNVTVRNIMSPSMNFACADYSTYRILGLSNITATYGRSIDKIVFRANTTSGIVYLLDSSFATKEEARAGLSGVMLYYELATPVETPIDPDDLAGLAALNVESGGTLTFANQHGDEYRVPVPNSETWKFKTGSEQESLENVVCYDAVQTLTAAQKNTVRNNIGAADKDEVIQLRTDTINSLNVLDQKISVLESENTGDSEVGSSANLAFSPIVCWGDSLTYGYSDPLDNNNFDGYSKSRFDHRQRICYPSALAEMVGRPVINLGVSGETCQTIMARQGADPMLTPAFTIPADTTPVEIGTFGNLYNGGLRTLSGRNATILGYGNSGINPCYIKGVKGYLTATGQQSDRSGIKYYFQRETAGTAVSVPDGTVIQTYAMRNLRKGVAIIWMGYNGQFSGPQDMVNKINSMIEYGHYSDYLVLTCNEQYADDSYGYYKAAWGNRFLYLRPLLGRIGVQEAGLWSDGTLKDNGIAQELDYDGVHFNSYGCKAIASFVFKRLLENGSLSKIEEPEVEPDDPNVPGGEDPQDPPVSNPVVDHLDLNGTYNNKHYILKSNEEFTLGRDSYYVTDFAPYGTDLASNDFTMCMKFTGTPSDEMALYTANYNKSYGDQRGISAIWDGSTVSFVLGNNTFNLASGGCTVNSDGVNTLIMRKQGTTFGVYCNGTWLHGNTSIGSNVSGAAYLANLKLLLGANRSSGNKDNIVQSTGTLVVSNMVLYDSALSNNEITDYQFPA